MGGGSTNRGRALNQEDVGLFEARKTSRSWRGVLIIHSHLWRCRRGGEGRVEERERRLTEITFKNGACVGGGGRGGVQIKKGKEKAAVAELEKAKAMEERIGGAAPPPAARLMLRLTADLPLLPLLPAERPRCRDVIVKATMSRAQVVYLESFRRPLVTVGLGTARDRREGRREGGWG